MIDSSLSGFQKTEQGYELKLQNLPKEELTFQLSSSEKTSKINTFHFYQIIYFLIVIFYYLIPVAGVILLILFFKKSKIQR